MADKGGHLGRCKLCCGIKTFCRLWCLGLVESSWQLEVEHFKDFFEVGDPTSSQVCAAPVDEGEESYDQLRIEVKDNCDWLRLVRAGERLEEVGKEWGKRSNDGLVGAQSHTPACKRLRWQNGTFYRYQAIFE